MNLDNKIKLSNKIYPFYCGLSDDLLFWVAVKTIFLTSVKGFNAAQISSLTTIGTLISLLFYPFAFRIIKKIGNINSIKLGLFLLLSSALLLTFSNQYILILLGYILYGIAFIFKGMDNVVIRKNLMYENREEDYIKIQSRSSFIYSFLTMIIAFVSGFLFNINSYLPMFLCIFFCINNIVLSNFLYEYKYEVKIEKTDKKTLPITKLIFFILILYALIYSTIALGQSNSNLFIQYKLSSFLSLDETAIVLTFIIAISRIVRVLSNFLFVKYFNKREKILDKICYFLIFSLILIIIGGVLKLNILGVIFMSIGFFIFLGVRDPFTNYVKTLLLNNCEQQYHEQAITYLTFSQKLGTFLISSLITLLLFKADIIYIMLFLLIIVILSFSIISRIYKLMGVKIKKEK